MLKKHKAETVCICLCFILFLTRLVFGDTRYEINDDMHLNLIAAGAFSSGSQYLVFCNILYGFFLKCLYALIPGINWYLWVMLLANLSGVIILSLVLSGDESRQMFRTVTVTLLVNWLLDEQFYNSLQWTKNASFYSVLLYVCLLCFLKKKRTGYLILSGIYCFFSIGLRDSCFIMLFPFGILFLFGFQMVSKENLRSAIFRTIKLGGILLLFFTVLSALQAAAYSTDGWKEFRNYTRARAAVMDYATFDETAKRHQDELISAGIGQEDIDMLRRGIFDDPEYFTEEKLETIAEICGGAGTRISLEASVFRQMFFQIKDRTVTFKICMLFWLILILFLLFVKDRWLKLLAVFCMIGIVGEYWYLACQERLVWRVEYGVWLTAVLLCLTGLSLSGSGYAWNKKIVNYLFLAAVLLLLLKDVLPLWNVFSQKKHYSIAGADGRFHDFFKQTGESGLFYLGDGYIFMDGAWAKNIFDIDRKYKDYFEQFSSLGDWDTQSPPILEKLERHGISNPMKALLADSSVRLASDEEGAEIVLRYLKRHYDPDASVQSAGEISGVGIWQFSE